MLSLKAKLALLAIAPIIISFGVFYYLNSYKLFQPLETALVEELGAKVRLVANDIDRFFSQRVTDAKLLSHSNSLLSNDLATSTNYLKRLANDSEWISEIDLIDQSGKIIANSGNESDLGHFIWENYPPIKDLFSQVKNAKLQDVFILETTNLDNDAGAGILLLTPVAPLPESSISRYLLMELSLASLTQIVVDFQELLSGDKHVYVVRNSGTVVVSDIATLKSPQMFPDIGKHTDMLSFFSIPEADGHFSYSDDHGNEITASYIDLGEFGSNLALDWTILATARTADLMAPVREMLKVLMLVGGLLCLLMIVASLLVFRRIAVPLQHIIAAAEKIKHGQYAHRLSISGSKELVAVAEAFNDMAARIAAHTEELADSNQQLKVFNTIINASPTPIYLSDSAGRYLMVNQTFAQLHNLPPEEVVGKTCTDLFGAEYADKYDSQVKEVFATGQRLEQLTRVIDGKGDLHDVLITKFPILDSAGNIYAVAGIDVDLTDQKRLEGQLLQSQKMEAIGTLAGGIAHDFNNLLAAILGHSFLIERKLSDAPGIEKNIEQIKVAATRGSELVKQILTYSRRESIDLTSVSLSSCIEESLELLGATLPASIEIQKTYEESAKNLDIAANKTQLQQIFINLCTNATHAMGGQGVLKIGLRRVMIPAEELPPEVVSPGSYVQLSVSDNGIGMSAATISKIFDPFFTTKSAGEGTGMGLSVVQGLVKSHNGFMTVESKTNRGSTFKVNFPLAADKSPVPVTRPPEDLPFGSERILLVDDDQGLASACAEMLVMQGYRVTVASSGTRALIRFTEAPDDFDLVITDQTMPEMHGTELAAKLRAIKADIPLILCSGFCTDELRQASNRLGIQALCEKPVKMKKLAGIVRQVLDA